MTDIVETIDRRVGNEIAPFVVDDLRRSMAEAEIEDMIDELVEAFLDDAPSRMETISASVESAVGEDIRAAAHAYKSAAASIGARQLADLLLKLEVAGNEGDCARGATLLPLVRAAHDTVVTRLREEFAS